MIRITLLSLAILLHSCYLLQSQEIILMDRSDGNKVVNNTVITAYSNDTSIIDLTKPFVMLNTTDSTLSLFLRKTVHTIADSTIDYFCFGPKCWSETDTTDIPGILPPGVENYSFASHVVHFRRFETPPLPPGFTSITYTIYDNTTFSEPIEASVTVNYHLSPVNIAEIDENQITVFPIPARDFITIRSDDFTKKPTKLNIYNLAGEVVISEQIFINNGQFDIPISELETGIYFGKMSAINGKTKSFKFIVGNQ